MKTGDRIFHKGEWLTVVWSLRESEQDPPKKPAQPVTAEEFAVMMSMIRAIQERLGA